MIWRDSAPVFTVDGSWQSLAMAAPSNFHQIPLPDTGTSVKLRQVADTVDDRKVGNAWRPRGNNLEPPLATAARVALRLIDRTTGIPYSADEFQAKIMEAIADGIGGRPLQLSSPPADETGGGNGTAAEFLLQGAIETTVDGGKHFYVCVRLSPVQWLKLDQSDAEVIDLSDYATKSFENIFEGPNLFNGNLYLNGSVAFTGNSNFSATAAFSAAPAAVASFKAAFGVPSGSGSSSGTNTGDQTSIVGITGTKSQFNTAITDDDFAYIGANNAFTGANTIFFPGTNATGLAIRATDTGYNSGSNLFSVSKAIVGGPGVVALFLVDGTGTAYAATFAGAGTGLTGTAASLTAGSAAKLSTAITIGGSSFDGSANVSGFPSPGPIGGTTASTGAFTTVSASTIGATTLNSGTIVNNPANAISWSSSTRLYASSDGLLNIVNNAQNAGLTFDVTTDGTIKLRNRANSADANITAGSGTFAGVSITGTTLTLATSTVVVWGPQSKLRNLADGIVQFGDSTNTKGVTFDFATTDGTVTIRTRANAGPGNIAASAATFTGISTLTGGMQLGVKTVGTLPTASSNAYLEFVVTDSLSPAIGSTVSAGGSAKCRVMSNGTNYIVLSLL